MNRYNFAGGLDRPHLVEKRKALQAIYDEIASIQDIDPYNIGWSARENMIIEMVVDYWKNFNPQEKDMLFSNTTMFRDAIIVGRRREMILKHLEEILKV